MWRLGAHSDNITHAVTLESNGFVRFPPIWPPYGSRSDSGCVVEGLAGMGWVQDGFRVGWGCVGGVLGGLGTNNHNITHGMALKSNGFVGFAPNGPVRPKQRFQLILIG